MRTLVVSDLHLGLRTRADVLRRPEALAVLADRLAGVDRLVLLGDTLELRQGPVRDAVAAAEAPLRAIGAVLGPDAEVVLVPGNHDHALLAPWLEAQGDAGPAPALGLERRIEAADASRPAARLAALIAPARLQVAYPGVWLRDDVYATHGHHLDVHTTVPTIERLAIGAMGRVVGAVPDPATAEDYEAVLAPLYAWLHAIAHRAGPEGSVGTGSSVRAWRALGAGGRRPLRHHALALAFRLGVRGVNRAGLGPVEATLSGAALRQGSLNAMGEVVRRLGIDAEHVVFGHTHRTGALPGDRLEEWRAPTGARLHNAGNWVFETHFMGERGEAWNPYWPGGAIALDDDAPPRLERLLAEVPAGVLRPSRPA